MERRSLGDFGEKKAAQFLKRKGYKIVECNYSCRVGEVDIIAKKDNFIVFVEVKLRKNSDFAQAREFVTLSKQRRIRSAAKLWLAHCADDLQPRFDVVEVYAPFGERSMHVQINHIEDAFW